jgi:hypothetical protein
LRRKMKTETKAHAPNAYRVAVPLLPVVGGYESRHLWSLQTPLESLEVGRGRYSI